MDISKGDMYSVGCKYEKLKTNEPGPFMEIRDGLIQTFVMLDNITPQEVHYFKTQAFNLSFKTVGILSFFGFDFGDMRFEAPYNPFEIEADFAENFAPHDGIPFLMLSGEATTGLLLSIRMCGLPHLFSVALKESIEQHIIKYKNQYTLEKFNSTLDQFYNKYSVEESLRMKGERYLDCRIGTVK